MKKKRDKHFQWSGKKGTVLATGSISAPNRALARVFLVADGIKIHKLRRSWFCKKKQKSAISNSTFLGFCNQLAMMLSAGISLERSLRIIAKQNRSANLQIFCNKILDELKKGSPLSMSLEIVRQIPNKLKRQIEIGELIGDLPLILKQYTATQERIIFWRRKLYRALTYPFFLSVVSIITLVIIIFLVIPRFLDLYKTVNLSLPFITRIVLTLTEKFKIILVLSLSISCIIILLGIFVRRNRKGALKIEALCLRLPFLGKILELWNLISIISELSSLYQAGIGLVEAFSLIQNSIKSLVWSNEIQGILTGLKNGSSLGETLEKGRFPDLAIYLIISGIESGQLSTMLKRVEDHYTEVLDEQISARLKLIEPIIISFFGLFLGFLMIALYLPIFRIGIAF